MKAPEEGLGPINRCSGTENQSLLGFGDQLYIELGFLKEREAMRETSPVAREERKSGNGEKSRSGS